MKPSSSIFTCSLDKYDAALLARHVYKDNTSPLPKDWKVCNNEVLKDFDLQPEDLEDKSSGLVSNLYFRNNDRGGFDYVYATAGTDIKNSKDWIANIAQLAGMADQYSKSKEIAKRIANHIVSDKSSLTFVGHSQGGGEAALNAIETGHHAITFNAAGVSIFSRKVKTPKDKLLDDLLIDAYYVKNDILSLIQDNGSIMMQLILLKYKMLLGSLVNLPRANGKRICIGKYHGSIFDAHKIDSVIELFLKEQSS